VNRWIRPPCHNRITVAISLHLRGLARDKLRNILGENNFQQPLQTKSTITKSTEATEVEVVTIKMKTLQHGISCEGVTDREYQFIFFLIIPNKLNEMLSHSNGLVTTSNFAGERPACYLTGPSQIMNPSTLFSDLVSIVTSPIKLFYTVHNLERSRRPPL
jgi:hypothetical protein